jgi:peptide/nickel transport system substrate-binding protein
MRSSKRLTSLVAVAASGLLVVAACSSKSSTSNGKQQYSPGYSQCQTKPDDCNSGERKDGGQIVVALGKVLPNFNVNADDGNLVETVETLNLIMPSTYNFLPSGKAQWNSDMLAEEPKVTSDSPQTVVYKLKPSAKWDDGTAISADDFTYAWQTLNGHDKNISPASTTGYELINSVTGSDNGKTVTVVFKDTYPDWKGLFSQLYPAHIAAKAGDIKTDAGLEAAWKAFYAQPTWSGGPFKVSAYDKQTQIEFVPNPNWYGADKPTLQKVVFKFITDPSQQIPALKNKEIQGFNVQPNQDIYDQLQQMTSQGVQYEITAGYSWEHVDLNTKNKWLADQALRTAIFDVISRQAIIDKTVKGYFPSAKPLGSHNFVTSAQGYQDVLAKVAPDQGNGKVDAATKVLTDAGYKIDNGQLKDKTGAPVGPLVLRHTATKARAATAEVLQSQLKQIGITLQDKVTDDLSGTLQKEDFDLILFGWASTPLLSGNQDLWKTGGGNNFTQWGDPSSDQLLAQMTKSLDLKKQIDLLNQQDEILTKAAVVLPLYDKPNLQVVTNDYVNIRDNNAGSYFTYNNQLWGRKKAAQ